MTFFCVFTHKIWIPFARARTCLPGFFTHMDYVDSCEIRSDFTCKMRSEIDVFDVKCEIDDIRYHYIRFFVRIVIYIVGKLSICNRFWIKEKGIGNFYMRTTLADEGKLALLVCLSVSHVSCLLASLLDKACSKIKASFFYRRFASISNCNS